MENFILFFKDKEMKLMIINPLDHKAEVRGTHLRPENFTDDVKKLIADPRLSCA